REALDTDARQPGHDEVSPLVDQDQDADDDDERDDRRHRATATGAPISSRTVRRVSASTATQSPTVLGSVRGITSSARSISSAIRVKPMRRSRKASTAISLAALSTTGADPPRSRAARARRRHGNRSGSGSKN